MTAPFHEKELWSYVWFRSPQWERYPVLSATASRIWLKAPPETRQKRMSVDRGPVERIGQARCSAISTALYTEAAMKVEEARQAILNEEIRRIRMGMNAQAYGGSFGHADRSAGIAWPSSASAVRKMFRQLAKTKHPDAGGSAQEFIALQKSYERALSMAASP